MIKSNSKVFSLQVWAEMLLNERWALLSGNRSIPYVAPHVLKEGKMFPDEI